MPYHKMRRPEIVRWVEPVQTQVEQLSPNGKTKIKTMQFNASKFAVVFDDATIYIYEKDVAHDLKEDYRKTMIQTTSNQGKDNQKEGKNIFSKAEIVTKMQKIVEDFDFEQEYNKETTNPKSTQGGFKPALDPNSDKMTNLYQS